MMAKMAAPRTQVGIRPEIKEETIMESMKVEIIRSPVSTVTSVNDEEIDEVWAEEIILEEDGSPANVSTISENAWPSSLVPRDVTLSSLASSDDSIYDMALSLSSPLPVLTEQDEHSSSIDGGTSPPYILPEGTLSLDDVELLDENFQLIEDLLSMKNEFNFNDLIMDDEEGNGEEKAQALLDQHLGVYIKEESFSNWLDEKTESPYLDELSSYEYQREPANIGIPAVPSYKHRSTPIQTPHIDQVAPQLAQTLPGLTILNSAFVPTAAQISPRQVASLSPTPAMPQVVPSPPPPSTPNLIREFETVLHQAVLTPPRTPPTYMDLVNNIQKENDTDKNNKFEEEDLDTIINNQFASLYEEHDNKEKDQDWIPPSQNSPLASDWGSISTPNPTTEDSDSVASESDPEWSPSLPRSGSSSSRSRRGVSSVEDRKMRKKEQNKNAATRYRMKKKAEQAGIVGEESVLLEENTKLKEKATDIEREIKYLKSLMRDVYKAKGLIR